MKLVKNKNGKFEILTESKKEVTHRIMIKSKFPPTNFLELNVYSDKQGNLSYGMSNASQVYDNFKKNFKLPKHVSVIKKNIDELVKIIEKNIIGWKIVDVMEENGFSWIK